LQESKKTIGDKSSEEGDLEDTLGPNTAFSFLQGIKD
jgi:hypothetical protein